jgi:hypothetical protein
MATQGKRKRFRSHLILAAVATLSVSRLSADEPRGAGIFVEDPQTKAETRIEATLMAGYEAQGVAASIFTAGLAKPKVVWNFGGAHAETRLPVQPVFRFRFDPKANASAQDPAEIMAMMMGGGPPLPATARNPDDFTLLVLDVGAESRELTTSTSKTGATKPKNASVAVVVEKVAPNDFRVRTKLPLTAGEYGFLYRGSDGQGKIWAFGVD